MQFGLDRHVSGRLSLFKIQIPNQRNDRTAEVKMHDIGRNFVGNGLDHWQYFLPPMGVHKGADQARDEPPDNLAPIMNSDQAVFAGMFEEEEPFQGCRVGRDPGQFAVVPGTVHAPTQLRPKADDVAIIAQQLRLRTE